MKKRSLENKGAKPEITARPLPGTLYICATPIGNLDDVSVRLLATLNAVDHIAAEDTRVTYKLLSHYKISKPLISYHDYNKNKAGGTILEYLAQGKSVALVSDAGTPGISDPGYHVLGEALRQNIKVVPIPGPSAIITALCACGLPTNNFIFDGFLPQKEAELMNYLSSVLHEKRTLVWYESPHRLNRSLAALQQVLGNRRICIARELTKMYEEFFRGTIAEAVERSNKVVPQGEFVLILEGDTAAMPADVEQAVPLAQDLLDAGLSKKDIAKIVSKHYSLAKNDVYERLLEL